MGTDIRRKREPLVAFSTEGAGIVCRPKYYIVPRLFGVNALSFVFLLVLAIGLSSFLVKEQKQTFNVLNMSFDVWALLFHRLRVWESYTMTNLQKKRLVSCFQIVFMKNPRQRADGAARWRGNEREIVRGGYCACGSMMTLVHWPFFSTCCLMNRLTSAGVMSCSVRR